MDKVYVVFENADSTEGRGPMVQVPDTGFFVTEKEAWDFADTLSGVMGQKPQSGSWRTEKYSDVQVRVIYKHSDKLAKKKDIIAQIKKLEAELKTL